MTNARRHPSPPEPVTGPGTPSTGPEEAVEALRRAVYRPSPSALLEAELLASEPDAPDASGGPAVNR